jgi:hypothetical protein
MWNVSPYRVEGRHGLFTALAAVIALFIPASPPVVEAHTRITTDVTWSGQVREIVREKCMICHHVGGLAPDYVDFTVYGTDVKPGVLAWRASMLEQLMLGQMPPGQPDERFSTLSNSKALTPLERELLIAWIEGGGPQGPLRELAQTIPEEFVTRDWQFGEPDIWFAASGDHRVAEDKMHDSYETTLPIPIEEDTWITGVEFLVGNPKNTYSVTAFLHDPPGAPEQIEVEVQTKYDFFASEDEGEVTRLRTAPEGPHFIGQWVRGDSPIVLPEASGIRLRKGSKLELRFQYERPGFAEHEAFTEDTKVGFYLAGADEEIDIWIESKRIANDDFVIKADAKKQEVRAEYTLEESGRIITFNPTLGVLATNLKVDIHYPDGLSATILWIPEYQKRWASSFRFQDYIAAPAGTRLEMTAQYSNTADNWLNPNDPPADVSAGEGPKHEQLYAWIDVALDEHLIVTQPLLPAPLGDAEGGDADSSVAETDNTDPSGQLEEATALEPMRGGAIRLASNQFHRVEATMPTPGEVQIYVYDDLGSVVDPRNHRGTLTNAEGSGRALELHRPDNDYLSGWVNPTFPQSVSTTLLLGGTEETFEFAFDSLTQDPNAPKIAAGAGDFWDPLYGGWTVDSANGYHVIELVTKQPSEVKLFFYDIDGKPLHPRNFDGEFLRESITLKDGHIEEQWAPLKLAGARDHFLLASLNNSTYPFTLKTRINLGGEVEAFDYAFDEETPEPWDEPVFDPKTSLNVGAHGSTQFYALPNGFHTVEGVMPRPGEFNLYVYDEWKKAVGPRNFQGTISVDGHTQLLALDAPGADHLTGYLTPEFPVTLSVEATIAGTKHSVDFVFEGVTQDPALLDDSGIGHMDHTPVHRDDGGGFFMVDNEYHHIEGTMPIPGQFRLYFYDDFKDSIDPRNFSGKVVVEKDLPNGDIEEEDFALRQVRKEDDYLSARVPGRLPYSLYALINFAGVEKRYDFTFEAVTKEPQKIPGFLAGAKTAADPNHSHYRPPFTIPNTPEGILAELEIRDQQLLAMIDIEDWFGFYRPAFDAKDLVAALAAFQDTLRPRQRGDLKRATRIVNASADSIDSAGDSQSMPRVQKVYADFKRGLEMVRKVFSSEDASN